MLEDSTSRQLGMGRDEAMQILNVEEIEGKTLKERYDMLMKLNAESPIYLQSKIIRARERLEAEMASPAPETN